MRFILDEDVPAEIGRVLAHAGHEMVCVRDVLATSAADDEVFEYAVEHGLVLATCNRDDFMVLQELTCDLALVKLTVGPFFDRINRINRINRITRWNLRLGAGA